MKAAFVSLSVHLAKNVPNYRYYHYYYIIIIITVFCLVHSFLHDFLLLVIKKFVHTL